MILCPACQSDLFRLYVVNEETIEIWCSDCDNATVMATVEASDPRVEEVRTYA